MIKILVIMCDSILDAELLQASFASLDVNEACKSSLGREMYGYEIRLVSGIRLDTRTNGRDHVSWSS